MKQPSKALIKKWYDKLKAENFYDIEDNKGYNNVITHEGAHFYKKDAGQAAAAADYFYYAVHFANEHTFDSVLDQKAWALHADGFSMREIAKEIGCSSFKVHAIINKYKKEYLNVYLKSHDA
jgi:hypothetical protein